MVAESCSSPQQGMPDRVTWSYLGEQEHTSEPESRELSRDGMGA